jgi:DNA-directed RNA polymerase specialized sigma24 family protein
MAAVVDTAPSTSRAELLHRLELALAALPPAERMAVVSAHGYGEGPVGAAVELDMDSEDADALTRNALQLLRAALAGLDDD